MKAHIGVDVASGLVHTVKGTAANEADIAQTAALLHSEEKAVFGDTGYNGADKQPELVDRDVSWTIAIKRSIVIRLRHKLGKLSNGAVFERLMDRPFFAGNLRIGRASVQFMTQ